jgi:hypothetical protein
LQLHIAGKPKVAARLQQLSTLRKILAARLQQPFTHGKKLAARLQQPFTHGKKLAARLQRLFFLSKVSPKICVRAEDVSLVRKSIYATFSMT